MTSFSATAEAKLRLVAVDVDAASSWASSWFDNFLLLLVGSDMLTVVPLLLTDAPFGLVYEPLVLVDGTSLVVAGEGTLNDPEKVG